MITNIATIDILNWHESCSGYGPGNFNKKMSHVKDDKQLLQI